MNKILFLCIAKSCRSQIAEGFARRTWLETPECGGNARVLPAGARRDQSLCGDFARGVGERLRSGDVFARVLFLALGRLA